jgi:uncharacterized protein DUF4326
MRAPLNDAVLVAAPSRWRNPYRFALKAAGPDRVVAAYERWLLTQPTLLAQLPDLRGKRLACYCPLDRPCHADVLARLANEEAARIREILERHT